MNRFKKMISKETFAALRIFVVQIVVSYIYVCFLI